MHSSELSFESGSKIYIDVVVSIFQSSRNAAGFGLRPPVMIPCSGFSGNFTDTAYHVSVGQILLQLSIFSGTVCFGRFAQQKGKSMDPLSLLESVGLVFFVILPIAIAAALIWTIAVLVAIAACVPFFVLLVAGVTNDYFYDKKMFHGKVQYRLPWQYRWNKWQVIGADKETYRHEIGVFYDRRIDQFVLIVRPIN